MKKLDSAIKRFSSALERLETVAQETAPVPAWKLPAAQLVQLAAAAAE